MRYLLKIDLDLWHDLIRIITAEYIKAKDMYDVSKMDDIWFESVLNEGETFRNGVAVLMDIKGYDYSLIISNLIIDPRFPVLDCKLQFPIK